MGTKRERERNILGLVDKRLISYGIHIVGEWATSPPGYLETFRSDLAFREEGNLKRSHSVKLFLDSGAYSAWTKGVEIDIQEYIDFIKEHKSLLEVYACLDVIGDPKTSLKNQRIMEKAGLSPLPCFHYGEEAKWLETYLKDYDYIALGGLVPIRQKERKEWLDWVFSNYICGKDGMPKVKIHGYGMTSVPLIARYPWFSVDSTTWVLVGRNGGILVPRKTRGGEWDFSREPWMVAISEQSPQAGVSGKHLESLSPLRRRFVEEYIEKMGFRLGRTENGEPVEKGLINDYKLRDEINIKFFLRLEKSIPEWPWPFQREKIRQGFDL